MVDRNTLASRNQRLAEARHATSLKHHLRRSALRLVAHAPVPAQKSIDKQRILLIRPDHLGDVLLTTPAIHALRDALPQAEIHTLVGPWFATVIADCVPVDAVLTLPFPGFSRSEKRGWIAPYRLAWQSARHLRQIGYSSAVILRPDHWWGALLAYLAGIPERIGYDLPNVKPFLTRTIPYQRQHAVWQNLRLVEHWTSPIASESIHYHFEVLGADREYIDDYLQERGITPEAPIFCIHPGSGASIKNWDPRKWAKVADALIDEWAAPVVFTGGDSEMSLVSAIIFAMKRPAHHAVGDTQIGQLAALLARAKVVLGPDSGPLHLAAAVGAPTVTLFGPADPMEFAPWGDKEKHFALTSDLQCRPCRVLDWSHDNPAYHPCVLEIGVGQVLEAARRVVNR